MTANSYNRAAHGQPHGGIAYNSNVPEISKRTAVIIHAARPCCSLSGASVERKHGPFLGAQAAAGNRGREEGRARTPPGKRKGAAVGKRRGTAGG